MSQRRDQPPKNGLDDWVRWPEETVRDHAAHAYLDRHTERSGASAVVGAYGAECLCGWSSDRVATLDDARDALGDHLAESREVVKLEREVAKLRVELDRLRGAAEG